MRLFTSVFISLMGTVFLSACGQQSFDEKMHGLYSYTVPLILTTELKQMSRDNLFILDVRSSEEYQVSRLRNARFIDFEKFNEDDVSDIPKDAQVVLYCSVGYRSERIGEKMQQMGFSSVRNLYGGLFDWKNKGNELINHNNQPTDSVHVYNRYWGQWLYNGIKVYE